MMVGITRNYPPFFTPIANSLIISYPPTKNNLIRIRRQVAEGEAIISDLPWAVA